MAAVQDRSVAQLRQQLTGQEHRAEQAAEEMTTLRDRISVMEDDLGNMTQECQRLDV